MQRTALATISSALLLAGATTLPAAAAADSISAAPTPQATVVATVPRTLVVDDDGVQCANRDFDTIGEAVAAANPGDTVRVCAGVYPERVDVTKQLRLIGQRSAVESVDCFDVTWSAAAAVDSSVFPVIVPPDSEVGSLIRLQADGIELAGFVVQGQTNSAEGNNIFAPAIQADGAYAGQWIHHNLIQDNVFGIELGSNGSTPSQVDHNCLRGNDFGLANQRFTTDRVRVDHNSVFRTRVNPFEVGTDAAGAISRARFDHNRSVTSGFSAYFVENATSVQLDHNSIEGVLGTGNNGIVLRGDNDDVTITLNQLSGTASAAAGVILMPPVDQTTPSTEVVVSQNTVEKFNFGIVLAANANTTGAQILENTTLANRTSGIQVGPTNTEAVIEGNVSDGNVFGIRTANAAVRGNSFVGNSMHANGTDAVESSFTTTGGVTTLNNTWQGNLCDTDSPTGTICVH